MATIEQVVQNFSERKINKLKKNVEWKSSSVHCRDNAIYSYGKHYILAYYIGEKNLFIRNTDNYSNTTASHQSIVKKLCAGPEISFYNLNKICPDFNNKHIVDWINPYSKFCYQDQETGIFYLNCHKSGSDSDSTLAYLYENEWIPPVNGSFNPINNSGRFWAGYWQIESKLLIKNKNRYYLFFSKETAVVPKRAKTVKEALNFIKPKEVIQAEEVGLSVQKMGKWFFVPTGMDDWQMAQEIGYSVKELKHASRPDFLPKSSNASAGYLCRHIMSEGTYVRGRVRHCNMYRNSTGKYPALALSGWHQAFCSPGNLRNSNWP